MDRTDYLQKAKNLLEDRQFYVPCENNPVKTLPSEINATMLALENSGAITPTDRRIARAQETALARFNGLSKVHKEGAPLRTIVSLKGIPTYGLAKWLFRRLKFLTANSDTTNCSSILFLEKLKGLLKFCLRTYFTFDKTIYDQVKGKPMGSPISGFIAKAVLQRLDSLVFQQHRPKFWARRRAFDAGLTPPTPLPVACRCVAQLLDTPDAPGIAAERFAKLRQAPRQSVDDFATELTRLASAAFPNLPHPDRDDLILHRFISGLLDRTITDSFFLHPPRTLNNALRQCRLYLTYHRIHQPPPRPALPPARPEPQEPDRRNPLPVRFPDHNPGCQYCAAYGPRVRHCAHNPPSSYHRRFIRGFAHIANPLHKLTEKGRPFARAFTDLRAALCSAPLLALPNVDEDVPPFTLETDASGYAIGAVLSQDDANGVEHPICFASNTLTKPQRNYCTFRRELLAIVVFLRQFKHLLVRRRFVLRTDHRALQWLRTFKDPMDQLASWQEFLQDFDFECQYRPGHKHGNADAFSRFPHVTDADPDVQRAGVNAIVVSEPTRHEWVTAQTTDPDTATIYRHMSLGLPKPAEREMRGASQNARLLLNQWPYLTIENDILFLRDPASNRLQPVVPGCLVDSVLTDLHTQLGHSGQRRTELAARSRSWWPQLRSAVQRFCQFCARCATLKPPSPSPRAALQPMTTGFPGERVGLDIVGPFPITVRGFEYVLVMVDYFTK
nr:unnamed protein product [Spirometra erinaceieuropaei]